MDNLFSFLIPKCTTGIIKIKTPELDIEFNTRNELIIAKIVIFIGF